MTGNHAIAESPEVNVGHRWTKEEAAKARIKALHVRRNPPPLVACPPTKHPRLEIVEEQIALTRNALCRKGLEPNERANLVRALDLLLDRERVLAGEPLPGSLKPVATKKEQPRTPPPAVTLDFPKADAKDATSP